MKRHKPKQRILNFIMGPPCPKCNDKKARLNMEYGDYKECPVCHYWEEK